jgi:hypothetical protein
MTYPTNIDPETLARLQAMYQNYRPGETDAPYIQGADGTQYWARYGEPTYNGEGSALSLAPITGYMSGKYDTSNGGNLEVYDQTGKDTGQSEYYKGDPDAWMDTAAMMAAGAFGGAFGLMAPGAAGTAAATTGTGATTGATTAGTDIFGGTGMATGFTDTGTALGALDTAYAGSGALTGATGLAAAGGAAGTAAGAATAGGLLSGAGSLLGPAVTALGAAAGAQGKQGSETTQRELPDYLKPYVTAPGGLLDSANTLMHNQMQYIPQQAQQISNIGLGLLQQPVAGNGFQQFMQRPRFGG